MRAAAPIAGRLETPHPFDATALISGIFEADPRHAPGLGTLPADWLNIDAEDRRAGATDGGRKKAKQEAAAKK